MVPKPIKKLLFYITLPFTILTFLLMIKYIRVPELVFPAYTFLIKWLLWSTT